MKGIPDAVLFDAIEQHYPKSDFLRLPIDEQVFYDPEGGLERYLWKAVQKALGPLKALKYNEHHDHSNGQFATSDTGSRSQKDNFGQSYPSQKDKSGQSYPSQSDNSKPTNSTQKDQPTAKGIPKGHSSAISFELAPGEGSPKLAKALGQWESYSAEEQHRLTQAVVNPLLPHIERAAREHGYNVTIAKPVYGSGAWMTQANPSSVVEVYGRPEAATWVMDRLGAALEQTGMFGHRLDSKGEAQYVDVHMPELSAPLDLQTTRKFWQAALEVDKASKTPGHLDQLGASPMMIPSHNGDKVVPTLRIINGEGSWTPEQITELRRVGGILSTAAKAVGLSTQRTSGHASTLWRENNWKEHPDGSEYRSGPEYTEAAAGRRSRGATPKSPGLSEVSLDHHFSAEVIERTRSARKRILAARQAAGPHQPVITQAPAPGELSATKSLDKPNFLKFNPNHDDLGRFATTGGSHHASPTGGSSGASAAATLDKKAHEFPVPAMPLKDPSTFKDMDQATWDFVQNYGGALAGGKPQVIDNYNKWYQYAEQAGLVKPLAELNAPTGPSISVGTSGYTTNDNIMNSATPEYNKTQDPTAAPLFDQILQAKWKIVDNPGFPEYQDKFDSLVNEAVAKGWLPSKKTESLQASPNAQSATSTSPSKLEYDVHQQTSQLVKSSDLSPAQTKLVNDMMNAKYDAEDNPSDDAKQQRFQDLMHEAVIQGIYEPKLAKP